MVPRITKEKRCESSLKNIKIASLLFDYLVILLIIILLKNYGKKIKEKGIHMKYFPTFDNLKNKVNDMLDVFDDAKNEVLALFGFYRELSA